MKMRNDAGRGTVCGCLLFPMTGLIFHNHLKTKSRGFCPLEG
ncbi:hypothetical protein HMPREF3039_03106 [Akkermansia sp. KLE1798]|nr:hypothetical protein HMPREF3039_03106 [Akkermansia sp. KLE1798]